MGERNVILTGFMGTGKTRVGRELAHRLGFSWVDTDALIESQHGAIHQIFAQHGEDYFRRLERAVAEELAERHATVVSTGGRMLLDETNASLLTDRGRVFCLTAAVDTILERLGAEVDNVRPLLTGDDPEARLRALLDERSSGYGRFEQVATDGKSPDEIVDELMRRLASDQSTS